MQSPNHLLYTKGSHVNQYYENKLFVLNSGHRMLILKATGLRLTLCEETMFLSVRGGWRLAPNWVRGIQEKSFSVHDSMAFGFLPRHHLKATALSAGRDQCVHQDVHKDALWSISMRTGNYVSLPPYWSELCSRDKIIPIMSPSQEILTTASYVSVLHNP